MVSRFPIVTTEFRPFTLQPAVGGDIIALKGFLHVKIQVEQAHLHIVTTHTQATYFELPLDLFCQTYLCRFNQLKELQAYVEGIPESGLVIVCGDFNQNASEIKPQQVADKVALMRQTNQFVNVIPLIEQEYQALIRALGSTKYELVDLALIKGFPSIPEVLDAILPLMDLTGLYLANEFSEKVDPITVEKYKKHHAGISTILIPHEEFKIKVGQSLAIIHTGDAVPYSSVILKSG